MGIRHPAGNDRQIPVDLVMMRRNESVEVIVAHCTRLEWLTS
jgi:hypothetical protein